MKITINNTAHQTTTTTNVGSDFRISESKMRRIRRTLCGVPGCGCGGDLSERGDSETMAIVDADGDAMRFVIDGDLRGGRFEVL